MTIITIGYLVDIYIYIYIYYLEFLIVINLAELQQFTDPKIIK